jgi:hypothetical protein
MRRLEHDTRSAHAQSLDRNGHLLSLTPMQNFSHRIDQPRVAEYGWMFSGRLIGTLNLPQ